jgi:fucose 4-O-acetylase-like acetyltransferase
VSNTALAELTLAGGGQHGISSTVPGIVALAVLLLAVIAGVVSIFSPRWRRKGLRLAGLMAAALVACYAVGRGIAEFWVVSYSDPASYEHSWGGPSLAGVFAVHTGPALVITIAAAWWLIRRRHSRERT